MKKNNITRTYIVFDSEMFADGQVIVPLAYFSRCIKDLEFASVSQKFRKELAVISSIRSGVGFFVSTNF